MPQSRDNRILFICSPFFGYYKHIRNALEKKGYTVDYYNDRPSENGFVKSALKLFPHSFDSLVKKYYKKLIEDTSNFQYEFVLIFNGKVLTYDEVSKLKKVHTESIFIFYTWDAINLYPNTIKILDLFDAAFSFDNDDCINIANLKHLPLFYTDIYKEIGSESKKTSALNAEYKYDILSICTVHPNRYAVLKSLIPYLIKIKLRVYSYMFIEPLQYLYNKCLVEEFRIAKRKEFEMSKLSENAIAQLFRESRVILDIPHSNQKGLTMRSFETLGAKRKLITSNKNIVYYDFYNENNIYIINNENWEGIMDFLNSKYIELEEDVYQKYSISTWVLNLISTKRKITTF